MTIQQSAWGKRRKVAPSTEMANQPVVAVFTHTVTADLAVSTGAASNGDKLELGILPAGMVIVDATLIANNGGAGTVNIGLMSGTVGDTSDTRTCDTVLFSGAADATVVRMSQAADATAFKIPATAADRSIGMFMSGALFASGTRVDLIVTMINDPQNQISI